MRLFQLIVALFGVLLSGSFGAGASVGDVRSLHSAAGSSTPTSSNYTLFAVLNPSSCADTLTYGPSALSEEGSEDGFPAYFCTDPPNKNALHTEWLQVINFENTPSCHIYWIFDTPRTLQDHFITAVNEGVQVSYSVECHGFQPFAMQAVWRFSSSAGDMAAKFAVESSTDGFSDRFGAWGTGETQKKFAGVANFDGTDAKNCQNFYHDGMIRGSSEGVLQSTHMYFSSTEPPSASPSAVVLKSSPSPTAEPTYPVPDLSAYTLFAVLNSTSCADTLWYGPSTLTEEGSADGYDAYLCTDPPHKDLVHTQWLQVMTFEDNKQPCYIYWTFSDAQTVQDRFMSAVSDEGVEVSYYLECEGLSPSLWLDVWHFSSTAGDMYEKFAVESSTYGFSDRYGAWGTGNTDSQFSGIANFDGTDADNCPNFWIDGVQMSGAAKTYMYFYSAEPSAPPTAALTQVESAKPSTAPTLSPTASPTAFPSVLPTVKPIVMPTEPSSNAALSLQPSVTPSTAPSCSTASIFPPSELPSALPSAKSSAMSSVDPLGSPSGFPDYELFAKVDLLHGCSYQLMYGPSALTVNGSSDGYASYLTTNSAHKDKPHLQWLQIVASDGVEVMRLYWTFDTLRTLEGHFTASVASGVAVAVRVVVAESQSEVDLSWIWQFSPYAGNMTEKFAVGASVSGFSDQFAVWGVGIVPINFSADGTATVASFWGMGDFGLPLEPCELVYRGGPGNQLNNPTSYMYYSTINVSPTGAPTVDPARPTAVPTTLPTPKPSPEPSPKPSPQPSTAPSTGPSATPTALPTTSAPTMTSSVVPTVTPTARPSVDLTAAPSLIPSVYPSAPPSPLPSTVEPTVVLTARPTEEPSSHAPSPTTSAVPTWPPSTEPSAEPSLLLTAAPSPSPSAGPTETDSRFVSMWVEQTVGDLIFDAYAANQASCNGVLMTTIAAAALTPPHTILDLLISAAPRRLRGMDQRETRNVHEVSLQYTIRVPASSGVTYRQLSSQLISSVNMGNFTAILQENAAARNVSTLYTAYSTTVRTEDSSPEGSKSASDVASTLSVWIIVGIVIAVLALFAMCICFAVSRCNAKENKLQPINPRQIQVARRTTSGSPKVHPNTIDVEDVSVYFHSVQLNNNKGAVDNPIRGSEGVVVCA